MASFSEMVERIYRETVARIRLQKRLSIIGIVAAAVVGVLLVNQHAEHAEECALVAKQRMLEWQAGKTIDELRFSFDELREMQRKHFDDCMGE